MAYNKSRTLLFVETKLFSQLIKECLDDEEYRELQQYIMENPEVGKIIKGSGGIRKVRWYYRKGMGKSGGIRIIYYWMKMKDMIYMLTMYNKSEKENIDQKTLIQIAKQLENIK